MGQKDGKPEDDDFGSRVRVTVSKKTQKELQKSQDKDKKK